MKCCACQSEDFHEIMTTQGVLVDYCEKCGGIWLDKGEIYFFTKSPSYLRFRLEKAIENKIAGKRCDPKNSNPLYEIMLGNIVLDYDPISGGFFFDKDELDKIPGSKGADLQISIDQKVGSTHQKSNYKKTYKKVYQNISLPNLGLTSIISFFSLYGLLGFTVVTVSTIYDIRPEASLGFVVIFAALQYFLGPWFMDLFLKMLNHMTFVSINHFPKENRDFIKEVCAKNNMKIPTFGIIPDGSPNAFTYGRTPGDARIVLTDGMFKLLTPAELNGVIAHEIGHAVHWDMLVMTIMNLVPTFFYYLYRSLLKTKSKKGGAGKLVVVIISYIIYIISQYFVLWFSRVREYYADRFAGKYISPAALSQALVKIGYGLAGMDTGKNKKGKNRDATLESVSALGIFDAGSARSLAVTSYTHAESMGEHFQKESIRGAMKWDMWNPWAWYYELQSTHPLIAKRLLALGDQSMNKGEEPYITFTDKKPESYWDEFLIDMLVAWLPFLSIVISLIIGFGSEFYKKESMDILFVKGGLFMFGLTYMFKVWFSYRADFFRTMNIGSLLKKVKVSGIRGIPVNIKGKIIGRGVPGLIYSEDFIMQDDTGIIFLDYRQPIKLFDFLFGLMRAGEYSGVDVNIKGWYRRAPIPYIELYSIDNSMGERTCYVFYFKIAFGALCSLGGLLSLFM